MATDLLKTTSYLGIHLTVGFTIAHALTGSVEIAGGIALIEPCVNAVAFSFHEKAGRKRLVATWTSPVALGRQRTDTSSVRRISAPQRCGSARGGSAQRSTHWA